MRRLRRHRLRLVTVGSVPPDWGGATRGGVATFHQGFLQEISRHRVDIAGVLPLNLEPEAEGPTQIDYLRPYGDERDWYVKTIASIAPDVVKFFHLGHRWARWHIAHVDVPAVGSVRSWHQITHGPRDQAHRSRTLVEEVLTGISALIFLTEHTRREGERLGLSYTCPTYVIPNHLHPSVAAAPLSDRPRSGIVFVGSLIPRKRADLVIHAAAELGIPVTILGDGPEREALERLAHSLGVSARFLGSCPLEEVIAAYKSAEVLCVPSDSESFGNVYIEAAACGTPSVGFAPTITELGDLVGGPIGEGVASDATAEAVTIAVDTVLSERWDRWRLREGAMQLTPPRTVGRYVEVLRSVSSI